MTVSMIHDLASQCPRCNGTGEMIVPPEHDGATGYYTRCTDCGGSGERHA